MSTQTVVPQPAAVLMYSDNPPYPRTPRAHGLACYCMDCVAVLAVDIAGEVQCQSGAEAISISLLRQWEPGLPTERAQVLRERVIAQCRAERRGPQLIASQPGQPGFPENALNSRAAVALCASLAGTHDRVREVWKSDPGLAISQTFPVKPAAPDPEYCRGISPTFWRERAEPAVLPEPGKKLVPVWVFALGWTVALCGLVLTFWPS